MTETSLPDHVAEWHRIVTEGDLAALNAVLADDVVFHSPIVHTPQEGKALTTFYLVAAFQVLCHDQFRYVRHVGSDREWVLEFVTEIDGIHVNGVDMILWNPQGQIEDFKVMVRPLKAIDKVRGLMAEMLEELKG